MKTVIIVGSEKERIVQMRGHLRKMNHGDQFKVPSRADRGIVYSAIQWLEADRLLNGLKISTTDNKDGTFTVSALRKGA